MIWLRIVSGMVALGVMWSGVVLGRMMAARRVTWVQHIRWLVVGLATYGSLTIMSSAIAGVSIRDSLHPGGILQALPFMLRGAFVGGFVILPLGCIAAIIRVGIPRLREQVQQPIWFQAVALTTCFALLITSLELRVGEKRLTPEARIALLDKSLRALEDGDREMPRDTWDPDYVVRMVGRDPQRLFRWVQQNTFWIPYHGVLRGPVGVLMDRQGNSLDRAILLAVLLQKAGYTIRLAHGELSREQALEVLPRLEMGRVAAFARLESKDTAGPDLHLVAAAYQMDNGVMNATLQSQKQKFSALASELHARVSDQTDRLLKLVKRPEPADVWAQSFEDAMSALTDHWWVQGRKGWSWVDLDPLANRPGEALVTAKETPTIKDLPSDLHHAVTIRVIAEQWSSGIVSEHKTLEQLLRPSDLYGHSVTLQFFPSEWFENDSFTSQQNQAGALAQHEWDAFLSIDRTLLTAGVLPENGDDLNAVKGGEMGGIASAFSASMGLTRKNDNRQLSAVWIEYEIHVPGEKPRIVRRTVFDLLGPAARSTSAPSLEPNDSNRLTRSLALTMRTEIMPVACDLAPQFVSVLLAHHLVTDRDLFAFMMKGALPAGTTNIDQLLGRSEPSPSTLYALALARRELSQRSQTFIDRPNILSRHLYPVPAGDGIGFVDATDIVTNEVGVSVSVRDPFGVRVAQGVLDTNAESLFQPHEGISAGDAFAASRAWRAVASEGGSASVTKVKLPEDVRHQIVTDLNAGYSVIAPEKVISTHPAEFAGWWRIDSKTGSALGMGANGWGAETAENSSKLSWTARLSPGWKTAINRFATFGMTFLGAYGWCVTPLVLNQIHPVDLAKDIYSQPNALQNVGLKHSLGIWKGAIIPSVRECVGDSIFIAGITAWLLPVGVVGESKGGARYEGMEPRGQSEPVAPTGKNSGKGKGGEPNETGTGPNEPHPDPNPPKEDKPCPDDGSVSPGAQSIEQPVAKPTGPRAVKPPTAQEVADALKNIRTAEKANLDAASEYIRYQHRRNNTPDSNSYDPSTPGPADYDPEVATQLWKDSVRAEQAEIQAEKTFIETYDDYKFWNPNKDPWKEVGMCGGTGAGAGTGGAAAAIDSLDPALYQGPQSGNTQLGVGPPPDPMLDPDGPPTVPDRYQVPGNSNNPFADTQQGPDPLAKTQPGDPPNQTPSGQTTPGQAPPGQSGPSQSWDNQPCSWCSSAVPNFPDTPSNSEPWDLGPGLRSIWTGVVGAANATDGVGPIE